MSFFAESAPRRCSFFSKFFLKKKTFFFVYSLAAELPWSVVFLRVVVYLHVQQTQQYRIESLFISQGPCTFCTPAFIGKDKLLHLRLI